MEPLIDKSGSGRIIIPDILYESPTRMLVTDTNAVAAHLWVLSEAYGDDIRDLELKLKGINEQLGKSWDREEEAKLQKMLEQTEKDLEKFKEEERILFNLYRTLSTLKGVWREQGMAVIPCPDKLANALWEARPSIGDPPSFRDFPGWWNLDNFRVD